MEILIPQNCYSVVMWQIVLVRLFQVLNSHVKETLSNRRKVLGSSKIVKACYMCDRSLLVSGDSLIFPRDTRELLYQVQIAC